MVVPIVAVAACAALVLTAFAQAPSLKRGDGKADGKKSLGGSGEMVSFTLPQEGVRVTGIKIHGSRYGTPQPPQESFLIYFLNKDMSDIARTEMGPYSLFERGPEKWVEVKFKAPIEVPKDFWVALDFRAGRTKGVFVSYDTSTRGKFSRVGLPGMETSATDFAGDWMIEVMLEE